MSRTKPPRIYGAGIRLYRAGIALAAPFSEKARFWVEGRKNLATQIAERRKQLPERLVWMHCASLGEFEQGRPLLEALRKERPEWGFVLTFFSPSGYNIRKDFAGVDAVWYLPLDTRENASWFLITLRPAAGIFVKYDLWLEHIHQAAEQGVLLYLIAARFRPGQIFFQPWGRWHRDALGSFHRIFCQDIESLKRLQAILPDSQISTQQEATDLEEKPVLAFAPDTRFDRVTQIARNPLVPDVIRRFAKDAPVLIAGSTWPADERLLIRLFREELAPAGWKILFAPHEMKTSGLDHLFRSLPAPRARFSAWLEPEKGISPERNPGPEEATALVVDQIGLLSSLYAVGSAAYIGGGFGSGIHNTLEAAVYGLPLAFGPNYHKFGEAESLLAEDAARSVKNYSGLRDWFRQIRTNGKKQGEAAAGYVQQNTGGTAILLQAMITDLDQKGQV